MALKNTIISYGSLTKFIHWFSAFVIISLLIVGFIMEDLASADLKNNVYNIHKLFGISILAITIFRILWSLYNIKPKLPDHMARIERFLARMMTKLLYLALLIMPLSGWVMSTAAGHIPHIFGLQLPFPLITKNPQIANYAAKSHYVMAWSIILLVSLHVLAAIKHYFWNKDRILQRMLPKF